VNPDLDQGRKERDADPRTTPRPRHPQADAGREPRADRAGEHAEEHAGRDAATAPDHGPGLAPPREGAGGPGPTDQRLVRAVQGFVDDPRQSVKEADAALEDAVARMERAVRSHRDALRDVRQSCADGADTEALRVALTRYRALSAHLAA
jgi:hypothetical protein